MTRKAYLKRMAQHEATLDRLWRKMVDDTNEHVRKHGGIDVPNQIEKFTDSLCLKGSWIYDRIQGKICTTHNTNYRGSLTKKIRKALGYTL